MVTPAPERLGGTAGRLAVSRFASGVRSVRLVAIDGVTSAMTVRLI
jgi:hypothetical protein